MNMAAAVALIDNTPTTTVLEANQLFKHENCLIWGKQKIVPVLSKCYVKGGLERWECFGPCLIT